VKEKKKVWTVSDLPVDERPRERLLKLGPQSVSTQELLAIIIASGVKGVPVMMAAQSLLSYFGSLSNIADASEEELKSAVKGIGPAKIARLKACFELAKRLMKAENEQPVCRTEAKITNPEVAYSLIKKHIRAYKKEHFFAVSLDSRNRIIGIDEISTGTLEASVVHPRETFESAIKRHAAKIIIAHNHPSEDPAPSEDDIGITTRLKEAGLIMGIELIDHIVICKNSYFSFKEKGLIF